MTKLNTVVMDKGTLTAGVFKVQDIVTNGIDKRDFLQTLSAIESKSTHPIAKAIAEYGKSEVQPYSADNIEEISGHGLKGEVNGKDMLAGNTRLLRKFNIRYDAAIDQIAETIVVVAINNQYAGYVLIADEVKEDAEQAVNQMHKNGITQTIMLSGDKNAITQK